MPTAMDAFRRGVWQRVTAITPARVDIGGRLDLPEFFLQFPSNAVGTCNIAIDLPTTVTYEPGDDTPEFVLREAGRVEHQTADFDPRASCNPYFWLAVRHFGMPGGTYTVSSSAPRRYGLGGSSSFMLALLATFRASQRSQPLNGDADRAGLVEVARAFENALGLTCAGLQDYAAALHGYANWWSWGTSVASLSLAGARQSVCTSADAITLNNCMLLAITGEPHPGNRPAGDPERPLSRSKREGWLHVAALARRFAHLVQAQRLDELHPIMKEERETWCSLSNEQASSRIRALLDAADGLRVGARFAGVPSGGAVWAIGSPECIRALNAAWAELTTTWPDAYVRTVKVASGLELSFE